MTEYNFHSTDPDNFNEVQCPVIYTGTQDRVRWLVSDITTNHNIVVLSPEDYIEFDLIPIYLDKYYTDISDSFMDDINTLFKRHTILAELKKNSRGLYYIESSTQLNITDISYNLRQVLGFYCENFPIASKNENSVWRITAKGVGFTNFSPVWFLISNLGQPIQINREDTPWTPMFPAIVMKIQNSFQAGQPLTYSNSDYVSVSPPSALSNLRVKLVDSNLVPIKLLNPLYVSVSVQEISMEEKQPVEEALAEQESNPDTKKNIQQVVIKYHERKDMNQQKVEAGPTVEPQSELMMTQTTNQLYENDH